MRRDSGEDSAAGSDGEADIIGPTSPAREPLAPGLAFLLPTPATNVDAAPSSPNSAAPPRSPRRASSAAADRFRASVNRVVQMQRMSTLLQPVPAGAEPGVDPRRVSAAAQYSHIRTDCNIEVIDYGAVNATFKKMSNRELVEFLTGPKKVARPPWGKVRWINVGGVSWDVVRALAIAYDLHPLSIEDVLHRRRTTQSKASYYSKHIFVTVLAHTLADEQDGQSAAESEAVPPPPMFTDRATTSSPTPEDLDQPEVPTSWLKRRISRKSTSATANGIRHHDFEKSKAGRLGTLSEWEEVTMPWTMSPEFEKKEQHRQNTATPRPVARTPTDMSPQARAQAANLALVDALKEGERVKVDIRHVYIFLLRDGTLISIHQDAEPIFGLPIIKRLRQRDTLLRNASDASLLLQSIIDLIVDNALQIVDVYHDKILKLERDMLIRAKMKTVRFLHILSGDLTLHKRTLDPIRSLVYGLRRYDLDRVAALLDSKDPDNHKKAVGFMSHQAKVYLADVLDHMDYILSSLDMFAGISENLINFTFNTISYQTNEFMRRLSLVTVIFFPLTFLTGYFGMNFYSMFSVTFHTDVFFWEVAFPVMAAVIALFCWTDLVNLVHFIKKKMLSKKVEQWHTI